MPLAKRIALAISLIALLPWLEMPGRVAWMKPILENILSRLNGADGVFQFLRNRRSF
jgi:hypothetical protein